LPETSPALLASPFCWNGFDNATNAKVIATSALSSLNVFTPTNYAIFTTLVTLKAQIAAYHIVFITAGFVLLFGAATSLLIRSRKVGVHVMGG